MGWRPGMPPTGYYNRAMNGLKDIVLDPERAPFITEMFERVAKGDSGRTLKRWLDSSGMTTRTGKKIHLGNLYLLLKNPFYYGEFEYPVNSGNWYKGKHQPLITKDVFEKAQKQLKVAPKSPWGSKTIPFKGLFKCGNCGLNIIGEEKIRQRKWGEPVRHVYYHCIRGLNACKQPYISEEKLVKQILRYINFMSIAHPHFLKLTEKLKSSSSAFFSIREEVLYEQDISPNSRSFDPVSFSRYILYNGSIQEKRDLVAALGTQMYIKNKFIASSVEELQEVSKEE